MARQPAFTPAELAAVDTVLGGFPTRDVCLYRLVLATGLRISEALRVRIGDVMAGGDIRSDLVVNRANLKGGRGVRRRATRSRTIPLGDSVRPALRELVFSLIGSSPDPAVLAQPLFQGRAGRALCRRQATYRLRRILLAAGLHDRSGYGWHCARRTFAASIYYLTGHDINLTRQVLGHAHLETSIIYLPEDDQACRAAILALDRSTAAIAHPLPAASAANSAQIEHCLVK